jgi:hypothetical protein
MSGLTPRPRSWLSSLLHRWSSWLDCPDAVWTIVRHAASSEPDTEHVRANSPILQTVSTRSIEKTSKILLSRELGPQGGMCSYEQFSLELGAWVRHMAGPFFRRCLKNRRACIKRPGFCPQCGPNYNENARVEEAPSLSTKGSTMVHLDL